MNIDWTEEPPNIETLKTMLTVPDVAQLLGYDVNPGDKIISPYNPHERTPSCHLYDDHYYCYSTGRGGDIIDLIIAHNPDLTIAEAVRKLWYRSLRAGREPGDVEQQPPRTLHNFTTSINGLPPVNILGYPTANYQVVDNGSSWLIPHREPDNIYGIKIRFYNNQKSSMPGSQFSHRLYDPYGWPTLRPAQHHTAVICEGETDCWALISTGIPADIFALPSGAGCWKNHWLTDLQPYHQILVATDNDQAGRAARDRIISKTGWDKTSELVIPPLFNDARAAIEAGWKPTVPQPVR